MGSKRSKRTKKGPCNRQSLPAFAKPPRRRGSLRVARSGSTWAGPECWVRFNLAAGLPGGGRPAVSLVPFFSDSGTYRNLVRQFNPTPVIRRTCSETTATRWSRRAWLRFSGSLVAQTAGSDRFFRQFRWPLMPRLPLRPLRRRTPWNHDARLPATPPACQTPRPGPGFSRHRRCPPRGIGPRSRRLRQQ